MIRLDDNMEYKLNHFYNEDCLEAMKKIPDKYFDLAIVDPPYGIGVGSMGYTNGVAIVGNALAKRKNYKKEHQWDNETPSQEYFNELIRISKNQIIWGGNYFSDKLKPSKAFIVWDKRCDDNMKNSFADCEYAWCSIGNGRMFRYMWNGMLQGDMKNKEIRFHPTQKPIALYEWLLKNYAKQGDKILDTHVGSASSLIACYNLGFEYIGFELDKEYYDLACKRLESRKNQMDIFHIVEEELNRKAGE